jgi:very-short-patch-repair endonuclease
MPRLIKTSTKRARTQRKKMSHAELKLWLRLRSRQLLGLKFRRQHPIGPYIVDFACLRHKLIIEVDGGGHTRDAQIIHDKKRTAFLNQAGWQVVRYWNFAIHEDLDSVVESIAEELWNRAPNGFPEPMKPKLQLPS